jgi:peptidoglycan/xylan/chitin deacetylase (PgdA/CDA1 family)
VKAGPAVAVLGYHKIGVSPGSWESWYYVTEATLAEHVTMLVEDDWTPLAAAELIAGLRDAESLPERSFLITFDDAYKSLCTAALPWLLANRLPAVVFVPTGHVGGMNEFDRDIEPDEPICDWDDLRELREGGVSIQSHAVSHGALSELTVEEQVAELRDSKAAIEAALGGVVDLLSYPYGDPGGEPAATASRLKAEGYRAAFGYGGGVLRLPAAQRFLLPRLAIGADTDLRAELASDH